MLTLIANRCVDVMHFLITFQSLINIHYLNWPIGFLHLFTCKRFIPGKIMRLESQGRDFEFCPRGNTGLLIKTIKMLINMTFYIKNTNESTILHKIACCLQMQKIPKTSQIKVPLTQFFF